MSTVAVVGSINLDVVVTTRRRPRPGETVHGTGYSEHLGGKGANQAVAAARVTSTAMVGAVGTDAAGTAMADGLADRGVEVSRIRHHEGPSGRAVITVTPDGENSIVVLALANASLTAGEVTAALDALDPAAVLTQLETPLPVTLACADWCTGHGRRFVLNPSPIAVLPPELVAAADPLIVNEIEAAEIATSLGIAAIEGDPPEDLAARLASTCRSVVVTAGADGAWAAATGQPAGHVAAPRVVAVDTTGAGDAFAGTLTAHLALGAGLAQAVGVAVAVAAELVATPRHAR